MLKQHLWGGGGVAYQKLRECPFVYWCYRTVVMHQAGMGSSSVVKNNGAIKTCSSHLLFLPDACMTTVLKTAVSLGEESKQ